MIIVSDTTPLRYLIEIEAAHILEAMRQKRQRKNKAEICSVCGEQAARLFLKNQTFGQGSRMIVIENVPTFVCDNCHESYITAEVSRAIDEILAHPDQYTSTREVSVATLAA